MDLHVPAHRIRQEVAGQALFLVADRKVAGQEVILGVPFIAQFVMFCQDKGSPVGMFSRYRCDAFDRCQIC